MLKIGYFADGPWSHLALEQLLKEDQIEIMFIVPRVGSTDGTLHRMSETHGIDYLPSTNVNDSVFLTQSESYRCDLFVSMSFDQIFKRRILDIPPLGVINCHAGKLPFYRGRNVLNWALINDEQEFGVSVHYVDEGIDTGDIILQKSYPITDADNYGSILERAYVACSEVLTESLRIISRNEVERISQSSIHPVGFYCGKRRPGDEIIDWNQTSREIFNFVRALSLPGPVARTFKDGKQVLVHRCAMVKNAPVYKNKPGQILAKTKSGLLVKTLDSFVELLDIECDFKLKVGDVLCKQ